MKAKTTKFLAVLAVLAMAFAGVAVLAQEQTDVVDAAVDGAAVRTDEHKVSLTIGETTTYYTTAAEALKAVGKDKTATITLLASHSGAGLQSPAADQKVNVTIDFAGFTYTVNDPVGSPGTVNSGAQLLKGNTYTFKNGTLSVAAETAVTAGKCYVINNYATLTLTDMVIDGTNLAKRTSKICDDPIVDTDNSVTLALWLQNGDVTINGSTTVITGTAGAKNYGLAVNFWSVDTNTGNPTYPEGAHVSVDTTGEINGILMAIEGDDPNATPSNLEIKNAKIYGELYTYAVMADGLFNVENATIPAGKKLTTETVIPVEGSLVINGGLAGGTIELAKSKGITMGPNATSENVKILYVDEYGDEHSFSTEALLTIGNEGLKVTAGTNMISVSGTVTLGAAATFDMKGNVTVSGMIYTTTDNTLTLTNDQADVKLAGLQVGGNGKVTLNSSVLVTAGTSFLVKGALDMSAGAVLKVAERAIVKVEGALTMTVPQEATPAGTDDDNNQIPAQDAVVGSAIWNAGQVIVPGYSGGVYDKQLIRVYMNSTAGTGKFFAGSVEYDGIAANAPLAVAYGAYLDVTGTCSVNLTSGGITVVNNLYRYYTMILATKDTTIPLTVDYDNQYPAKFNLKGKDYSGPETTNQSAVYRNVVWETPSVATIYVTAPEVYTVVLVKTYDGENIDTVWTDGLTVKDLQGRIIPISQETVADKGGKVQLVYGEKYTITGDVEENDYSFIDVNKVLNDLRKDSQIQGSFTMIRNIETDQVEIQIEMGKLTVVTVNLTDTEKRIAAGDVVLSYSVDDGKTYKDVVMPEGAGDAITFNIFSNQTALLKYPAVDFFKFTADLTEAGNVINKTADITAEQSKAGWINAFKIKQDNSEPAPNVKPVTATIGLTCALNVMVQTFNVNNEKTTATAATLTITFEEGKYYSKGAHKAVETINFSATAPVVSTVDITMYKGEVFSMTWTDIPDAREEMTYKATGAAPTVKSSDYTYGAAFNVDKAYTFTLAADDIEYVNVLNSTNTEAVITDNDVAKSGVTLEAQKLKEKAIEQINENLVKLSVKGSYVISWSYKLTVVKVDGDNTTTGYATGTVSGASALFNFQNVVGKTTEDADVTGNVTTMEITNINSERIVYWVQINQDENLRYDKYSAGGYMNDVMKVWATPATGFKITKIDVYYWSQATGKGAWYAQAEMDESAGQAGTTVWTYTMPASDVLLVPDVDSNYATITYKNEDGTVLQETPQLKGALPVYSGATPTKPATATETYEFAGWSPTPVIVTEDATYVAQFRTVEPTSTNVTVAIGQTGADVNFIVFSNDQKAVGAGKITYTISYTYVNELGRQAVGHITDEVSYDAAESQTFVKLTVTGLADALKDNYNGAFAVTGTYTFGDATGSLSKTVYNPVLEA